ncbi:PRC-barrel domain-containing protein [Lutimaribacter sp. EGI FJ00015]|nr:PRC-barrel domain-containing protein [Lutimaribacter sp. EGI FJ00015]
MTLGFPTMTLAQSTDTASTTNSGTQQHAGKMSGFLSQRGQADLYASDLIGRDVHARSSSDGKVAATERDTGKANGKNRMSTMNRADLDEMETIGQINEIVLSSDGQVRAFVIGVGGFLGVGEQDIAVTMDQVTFASDADDQSHTYIVMNTGADMLKDAPAYAGMSVQGDAADGSRETVRPKAREDVAGDDDQKRADRTTQSDDAERGDEKTRTNDRTAFTAPDMEREGYDRVEARDVSTEMLMGMTVYDVNDNNVGDVQDMILDDKGAISNVVIDFGGFLGIGSSQASLGFGELTILTNEGYDDVRIYVDATKEQIQELPRYMASK